MENFQYFENNVDIPAGNRYNKPKLTDGKGVFMVDMYSVALSTLTKEFNLEVVYASTDFEKIRVTVADVGRPGLPLTGYFDHFEPMRLQVMGNVEISYLQKLTDEERLVTYDRLLSYKVPALLISRGIPADPQCL